MRGLRILETRRARELRIDQTSAEAKLWAKVHARRLNGFKFTRQEPVGGYIADFCCRAEKLVVEIDGATHSTDEELARDHRRTAFLTQAGYRVVRFHNAEVFENMDSVLETILAKLERRDYL
jgi:very-short-patch-repair endonuclease